MGSVVSGLFGGGDAAKDAGAVQAQASKEAIEEQRRQFDISQENIQPYLGAGIPALNQYMALLGLGGTTGAGGITGAGGGSGGSGNILSYEDWAKQQKAKQASQFGGDRGDYYRKEGIYYYPDELIPSLIDPSTGEYHPTTFADTLARGFGDIGYEDFDYYAEGIDARAASKDPKGAGAPSKLLGVDASQEAYDKYVARRASRGGGGGGGQSALDAQQAAMASLIESPGQRFIRDRAQRNLLQGAAAIGGIGGGNVRSSLVQQGAGFAQQDLENRYSRLQNLISGGQNSAIGLANLGQQQASSIGNLLQSGAQARASGILGAQQAKSDAFGNLVSLGGTIAGIFSDKRLKEDIREIDLKSCFEAVTEMPLMSWRYLESVGLDTDTHIGPMAQDAPDMIRMEDMSGVEMLNLHDELMMIAGALQYMKREGMIRCH